MKSTFEFNQLIISYIDAFDEPEAIERFPVQAAGDCGLFITSYDEGQDVETTLMLTIGLSNIFRDEHDDPVELSFHYRQDAFTRQQASKAFIETVQTLAAQRTSLYVNEIVDQLRLHSGSKATIVLKDHIFEAISYISNEHTFDIPIFRLLPLLSEEVASLETMPRIVRHRIILELSPILGGAIERETEFLVHNAVKSVWDKIFDWHQQSNTFLWQTVQSTTSPHPDIEGLEQLLGYQLPLDLKTSWLIQNRRLYLTDYEYMDVEGVKYLMRAPVVHKEISMLPFAEDSGGNMICVDMREGRNRQVVQYELSEGFLDTNYYSFFDWLWHYKDKLLRRYYRVDSDGFLEEQRYLGGRFDPSQ